MWEPGLWHWHNSHSHWGDLNGNSSWGNCTERSSSLWRRMCCMALGLWQKELGFPLCFRGSETLKGFSGDRYPLAPASQGALRERRGCSLALYSWKLPSSSMLILEIGKNWWWWSVVLDSLWAAVAFCPAAQHSPAAAAPQLGSSSWHGAATIHHCTGQEERGKEVCCPEISDLGK